MLRIDTHQHVIPPDYRKALQKAGVDDSGGRAVPDWTVDTALQTMAALDIASAILWCRPRAPCFCLSLPMRPRWPETSTTTPPGLSRRRPTGSGSSPPCRCRISTSPSPRRSVRSTILNADGVVLLANNSGTYLGEDGQDDLFAALDARSAVVFIHPHELPGPTVPGMPAFAADFLLDTTRAAYLLVRNGIRQRYPNIRFILGHAGGFVPYASHRLAISIMGDTGRSPADSLNDFSSFYFDTALSSSAAALPTLLAFAQPGHVTFGSTGRTRRWRRENCSPAGLETFPGLDNAARDAIDRTNALALFFRDSAVRLHPRCCFAHRHRTTCCESSCDAGSGEVSISTR